MNERTDEPEPEMDVLIERLGRMVEEDGLSRTVGRILGVLLISDTPLSFTVLAQRLTISRGGLSSNTRLLQEMGLIERVAMPGSRQDYFQVPANVWRIQVERQMKRDAKARAHVEAVLSRGDALPDRARERLATLVAILSRSDGLNVETLALLEEGRL